MEQIICENLSFAYPLCKEKALSNINLKINRGEFVVLCGKSGCGKTTLLRHFKSALTPAGERSGRVLLDGVPVSELSPREAACRVGFVMQEPDSQIVTDKVWHELAFGLENIGAETADIRLKTAEMASYFGISEWFDKKTDELSGGQKQLLNLAAVMVMNPDVIVLDEPSSQLDPVAAGDFLSAVSKINRELGVTVIMTEHRLEDVFCCASRVLIMENGKIKSDCSPRELSREIRTADEFVRLSMPSSVRINSELGADGESPLSVNEGAAWLSSLFGEKKPCRTKIEPAEFKFERNALEIKNLFFRYEKNGADVISNLSLNVPEGSAFAVMGGNGEGKSTLLKIIAGALKPISGKVRFSGRAKSALMLPQSVQSLFTKKSVSEELAETGASAEEILQAESFAEIFDLEQRHPFDLSGGEQQRLALAKLMLKKPDILLLDEPTKGMDCEFKQSFAKMLKSLAAEGKTVVMVSHDIEFCAACADFCAMMFDSAVACVKDANSFFAGNFFYTTSANRMSRHIFDNCVTDKDVISLCRENLGK